MFFPKTIAWTLAAATSLATSPAHAAPDPQPDPATQAVSMEEVVVTAGFRDTELMTSAGSISVLDREAMVERAARHLQDTLATMPNVNFSVGGARARFVQMRGVGDLEQFVDPKHFPSVGIVLDGIELSNVASSALLFDAEQIEVLRGPQGTQFGASALAGMINIRSRDPGEEFEADFDAGYGNFESWHVSAAAGGPLSETLRARVAIRQNSSDGFMKNAFLGRDDTQNLDELTARAKFIWDITPDLSADVTTLYVDADNGYDAFTLNNTRTTLSDTPGSDAQEAVAVSARLRWDMGAPGAVQLQSTFSDADERYGFDEDWVFAGFCDGRRCDPAFEFNSSDAIEREREQVTVDLRWLAEHGKLSWVTGAYFHHRQEDMARERFGSFTSNYETDRYAFYGQLELALTERVTARLGIRGEAFNDDYDDSNAGRYPDQRDVLERRRDAGVSGAR